MSSDIQPPAGAAPPDWRGMCERLVSWAEKTCSHYIVKPDVLVQAQALLAQHEPEDDVTQLRAALETTAAQRRAEDDARIASAQPEPEVVGPTREEAVNAYSMVMAAHECQTLGEMAEHFARAVLARWGHQPAPAAEGEVAELVRQEVAE